MEQRVVDGRDPRRVVVQPEDNLFDIASIAGIGVMDLARYNNLRPHPESHFLKIYPGQVLYVPSRSLLDRLPAIDRAREPKYELSVRVTDVPCAAPPPTASSRLVHPSRHSRHKSVRESDDALESSNFAASLGVSLALCAAALAPPKTHVAPVSAGAVPAAIAGAVLAHLGVLDPVTAQASPGTTSDLRDAGGRAAVGLARLALPSKK